MRIIATHEIIAIPFADHEGVRGARASDGYDGVVVHWLCVFRRILERRAVIYH